MKNNTFSKQAAIAASQKFKESEYWLDKLSGDPVKSSFPRAGKKAGASQRFIHSQEFGIPGGLFRKLMELSNGSDFRLHIILAAALMLLMDKYTGNKDIIIGAPIYKQDIDGELVNMVLALRNRVDNNKTFKEFLLEVAQTVFDANENQNYPMETLLHKLNLTFSADDFPLFDTALLLENIHDMDYLSQVKLNMVFRFERTDQYIAGLLDYNAALYDNAFVRDIVNHFINLLRQCVFNIDLKISGIDILSLAEKKRLIYDFNDNNTDFSGDKTVCQLIEGRAQETPERIAVVFGEEHLTYRQLDETSNRLARYLADENQHQPDKCVGLLMERTPDLAAAILGIWKAGLAYVPIDPNFPGERIKLIINNAKPEVVISQKKFIKHLNRLQWECQCFRTFICMDSTDIHSETGTGTNEEQSIKKAFWEYTGKKAVDDITAGFWYSAYTGEPLPAVQMDEWGDNILKKLTPILHPRMRVLEIGCGSGLSMYRIAPKVGFYYGIDLSEAIIERNAERIKKEGHDNIILTCMPAHDVNKIEENQFDLVIMNSVIQLFPHQNYLQQVIRKAMDLMAEKGFLFLGDVPDLQLRETMIQDIIEFNRLHKNKNYKPTLDWSDILFFPREYFEDLKHQFPGIQTVECSEKIHTIENELTRFRYDTFITVNKDRKHMNTAKPRTKHKYQHDRHTLEKYSTEKINSQDRTGGTLHDLSYVIYTSGSTGKPKGVMIEHIGMLNHIQAKIHALEISEQSIVAQNASYTFDISVWQLFAALVRGGKTVIYHDRLPLEPDEFISRLAKDRVTILEIVPSYLAAMLDTPAVMGAGADSLALRYLLVTGEEIKPHLVRKWFHRFPGIPMVNAYGPTEASDDITHFIMDKALEMDRVPIGKPLQNLNIYIVDENMFLCPVGVKGEIMVSGIGVGRGYLEDEERTARVFMEDPFSQEKGVRLYKTGDLGRWLPDGTIEFFARKDYQVKIRGYRIEPGEIESRLMDFEGIKEAVVIDRIDETGGKYLCAYIAAAGKLDIPALKTYLLQRLPDYMVPSYFTEVKNIPLTPNGKVDRKALPAPSTDSPSIPYMDMEMLERVVISSKKKSAPSPAGYENDVQHEISEEEKEKVLIAFNDTQMEYPTDKTLADLLEEQVERTPDSTALVFEDQQVTFKEFSRRINRLAAVLRDNGVRSGSIVGLMVDRSIEIFTGIYGILKAGGAYLPIGYEYPDERKRIMLADSSVEIFLTDEKGKQSDYCTILIDIGDKKLYEHPADMSAHEPAAGDFDTSSTDPAYIIYTSGTTGLPKGVLLENKSLVNFVKGFAKIIGFNKNDIFLSLVIISFDMFVMESIAPLSMGARVVIGKELQQLEPAEVARLMKKYCITLWQGTPSMMRYFIADKDAARALEPLKYLLVSGEFFPGTLLEKLRTLTTGRIFNGYGPSETTVWSTYKDVTAAALDIGKPIANTRIYILGAADKPQPVGGVGELCIGGDGVGRGYCGKPELTAAKFVPDPFVKGERMYRTGDMARWLPDGNIEFLGRNDHQVKIGGIRVELEDIENQLLNHEDIEAAQVIAKENEKAERYFCAFVVSGKKFTAPELAGYLLDKLPLYMVPTVFIQLEKIPLLPNGKVNRRLLETIEVKKEKIAGFQSPGDEVENKLAEIWADVLAIPRKSLSINDNFFDLGGHSMKAINLVVKTHKTMDIKLPLAEIFKAPTIKALARYIKKTSTVKFFSVENAEKKEYYPTSPTQDRMYVAWQMDVNGKSYNMPTVAELEGDLSKEKLIIAFAKLIQRHESLKTSFFMMEGGPAQRIHRNDDIEFNLEYFVTTGNKSLEQEIIKHFIKPFKLTEAPLLRAGLIKTGEEKHVLMVDMHHIISDGFSFGILLSDFAALYNRENLPSLKIHYKDFSQWQNRYYEPGNIKKQEDYWLDRFKGHIPLLDIPTDYPRPAVRNIDEGEIIEFRLQEDLTGKLYDLVKETDTTIFILLLTIYNVLLFKYTGQEDIIVGSPITGRSHADLENVIGAFLNMLAIRNHPRENTAFGDFLQEVKESALGAFENQDYSFDRLVRKLELQGETGRNPLFDTEFAMNNMEIPQVEIPGLIIKPYPNGTKFAKFDLHFLALEDNGTIHIILRYYTALFKRSTIEKMKDHYIEIVQQVVENPGIKLEDIVVSLDFSPIQSNILEEAQGDFGL